MIREVHNGRSFGEILTETKDELRDFVETRITMLRVEVSEKLKIVKAATPLAAVAIVFLATAFLLFSFALVGLIAAFMDGNPFRWAVGFGCITVLWAIIGAVCASAAKKALTSKDLAPTRTIGVLKQDKVWIQREAKTI